MTTLINQTARCSHADYADMLRPAWEANHLVREALTDYRDAGDIPLAAECFEQIGAAGGYVIDEEGHLGGLFTTLPGSGSALVLDAISNGARTIDVFDNGFLVGFYARHGFVEYRRDANWTPGGPDVVWMKLACDDLPCTFGSIHVATDHANFLPASGGYDWTNA